MRGRANVLQQAKMLRAELDERMSAVQNDLMILTQRFGQNVDLQHLFFDEKSKFEIYAVFMKTFDQLCEIVAEGEIRQERSDSIVNSLNKIADKIDSKFENVEATQRINLTKEDHEEPKINLED